ncbi:MAG: ribosome biogenesis GTPase Der, partial [Acidobacteriota bacterium]
MRPTPVVVLVGAPNVGKSTLFNRLARRRRSLVHDQPGMTRDRLAATVVMEGVRIDLVDTGGVQPDAPEEIDRSISEQAMTATGSASLVVLVTDGRLGPSASDRFLVDRMRRASIPCVIAVNKLDTREMFVAAAEFHCFGVDDVLAISAEHDLGMEDLHRAVLARLPQRTTEAGEDTPDEIALALIGRPNVGKSSILNRLLREERVIVADTPGTTRDAIDTVMTAHGRRFRLVDTAGLRHHGRAAGDLESLAMSKARGLLARVDIVLLVIDAVSGLTTGDIALAGLAARAGRAILPAVNKWDQIRDREEAAAAWRRRCLDKLKFLPAPLPLMISAKTGQRVQRLLPEAAEVFDQFSAWLPTSRWNRALKWALE